MKRSPSTGATLKALLAAWVTLIFGTSLLIYLFAPLIKPVYSTNMIANMLRSVWEIGDAMGPFVKISLIAIFSLLVFSFQKALFHKQTLLYASSILFAVTAALVVLTFLPADYSRGYGVGLTGSRFDMQLLYLYLLGAASGGAVFAFTFNRLRHTNSKS